jgi:rhamnosyltransferase
VLPFLDLLQTHQLETYKACLKIHSKRSPHLSHGQKWRDELFEDLLNTSNYLEAIEASDSDTVIWTNAKNVQKIETQESLNYKRLKQILNSSPSSYDFIPGTMFWFNPKKFQELFNSSYQQIDFEAEPLINDGSWAHVFERYFLASIQKEGLKVKTL